MKLHLTGTGDGKPISEGEVSALPVNDRRLLCDPDGKLLSGVPSIVQLASRKIAKRTHVKEDVLEYVKRLVAPRETESDLQRLRTFETAKIPGGTRETVLFLSEIGEYIPALLWRPDAAKSRVVLIADSKGKAAVDESALVRPLLAAGYAVLAVDLRGRGETLGTRANGRDNNYHFVSHSIMWGQPLAGRRAFDVSRAVDYVESRNDLSSDGLVAVGIGDDALPVLLASTADTRISRAVSAGYDLSFASQMIAGRQTTREQLLKTWNSGVMGNGKLDDGTHHADAGSVVPGVLEVFDLPDLADIRDDRAVLVCGARNMGSAEHRRAWEAKLSGNKQSWFRPDDALTAELLLSWLK